MSWHDIEVGFYTLLLGSPLLYAGYVLVRAVAFTEPYWEPGP